MGSKSQTRLSNSTEGSIIGFPGGTSGKEPACQCRRCEKHGFYPWVGEIPWRRAWKPTPVFLPRESHGQRILVDSSPWCLRRVEHNWSDLACMHTKLYSTWYSLLRAVLGQFEPWLGIITENCKGLNWPATDGLFWSLGTFTELGTSMVHWHPWHAKKWTLKTCRP